MIDLYYWPNPNGHKITIFLGEASLDHRVHSVDISAVDQFKPEFLALPPNNRMPTIVDSHPLDFGEPISVFESGAMQIYPAGKAGRFLATELRGRKTVMEWLMWQMGELGPMSPLCPIRHRASALRHRPLCQGGQPPLRGTQPQGAAAGH